MAGESESISQNKDIPDLLSFHIVKIESIIRFVNHLLKHEISIENDIKKSILQYQKESNTIIPITLKESIFRDPIYNQCSKFYPPKFELKNKNGNEIQLKIGECMAVVQILWDTADKGNHLDGYRIFQLGVMLGSLEELMSLIDPIENIIQVYSTDQVHLIKSTTLIKAIGSRLGSLEKDVYGEDTKEDSIKVWLSLQEEDQIEIYKEYSQPKWILEHSKDFQKRCFDLILINEEIKFNPHYLTELFDKLTQNERIEFVKELADKLSGKELGVLIKSGE